MTKFKNTTRPFPGIRTLKRFLNQLSRRYRAHGEDPMSGGGAKLTPIAEVVARIGREPSAPD